MILCLDTSGRETLLGLAKDQHVREIMLKDRDDLKDALFELLDSMGAAPAEIAAIAIGQGPGSFTGLRVGFAFAHGLARGLDVPLWPVPSFDVLAHKVLPNSDTVTVLAQARKERWFAQSYGKTVKTRVVLDALELAQWLPINGVICGPGCRTLPDELQARLEDRIPAEEILHRPQADALIELARTTWKNRERLAIGDVLPDYGLEFGAA